MLSGLATISVLFVARDSARCRRVEMALRESEAKLSAVFETLPIGVGLIDRNGRLILANRDMNRYLPTGIIPSNDPSQAPRWRAYDANGHVIEPDQFPGARALRGEKVLPGLEVLHIQEDGKEVWTRVAAVPVTGFEGKIIGQVIAITDIDVLKRAEGSVRDSEERLRMIVDSISDYAIITTDTARLVTSWNIGAEKAFGWKADEVLGQSCDIIFTPEDRRAGVPKKEVETAITKGRAPDERFHLHKDGSRFYVSGVMTPLHNRDNVVHGFVKVARDMTDKIAAEKAVTDRQTLQRLVQAQEEERARLARDLHDEVGQQLTVMRLRLESRLASGDVHNPQPLLEELATIARSLDERIDQITWELRPLALEDLGLVPALEKYVKEWGVHCGVKVQLIGSSLKSQRFKPDVETNLYRIVQEALNNVAKHARATRVEIMFERRGDKLVLIIEDDGKGFNLKNKRLADRGLGLTGMRERATLIGGSVKIESKPKKGTTVFVTIPAVWALIQE